MKKQNLFLALALYAVTSFLPLGGQRGTCQNIGINSTGATPNASALLDIDAAPGNSKGLLIPRLTTAEMNAISSPADGLIIYNTDCKSFNYYNGNTWIAIGNTGSVTAPGAITGSATPCQNATGVAYSITAVSGATGYNWTVPTGASVATGQGTTSVTVDFATTDGNICVTASNACGTSNASCTAITLQSAPAAPTATAASNIAQTSFDANWNASAGATTYYLDVATDAGFTSFVTGYNNLNVGNVTTYGVTGLTCATAYYYRVRVGNSCGTSSNSNTITVTTSACCLSGDDFTVNNWTVGQGTNPSVTGGVINFNDVPQNWCSGNWIYRSLNCSLSDVSWTVEFDYQATGNQNNGSNYWPIAFTSSATYPGCANNVDMLGFAHITNINTYTSPPQHGLGLYYKDDTGAPVFSGYIWGIAISNAMRYIRMQRTSSTNLRLEIYSDPARTTLVSSGDFAIPATVQGLSYIISGAGDNSNVGLLKATVDNLVIY